MAHRSDEIIKRLPDGPVIGAEIGVFAGATSARLLSRPDLTLYMIDTWAPFEADGISVSKEQQWSNRREAISKTLFAGYRAVFVEKASTDAAACVSDASFYFVFIDANHYYDAVSEDIELWRNKVKPGGLLCGHDYANNEYDYGAEVERAVQDAAKRHGWTVELGGDFTWFVRV